MRLLSGILAAMALAAGLAGAQDGTYLEALVLLGEAASTPREVSDAIARFESARADFQEFARYHLALADLHYKRGDREAAKQEIHEAIEVEPQATTSYLALGQLLERDNDLSGAEAAYAEAARLSPEVSAARIALADFYLRRDRIDSARKILDAITEDDPTALPAWRRLAAIALAQQDFDSARKAAATILNRLPSDLAASLLRGQIEEAAGHPAAAVEILEEVVAQHTDEGAAHFELAKAYLGAGDVAKARASLDRAMSLSPDASGPHLVLAETYLRTNEPALAVGALDPVLNVDPVRREALRLLGTAFLGGGDGERALDAWESYERAAPADPLGPFSIARSYLVLGNLFAAEQALAKALELDPSYLPALGDLVRIAFQKNQGGWALARAQKQLALVPSSAPHHRLVGEIQRRLGNLSEAEKSFRRALELDPSSVDTYVSLGNFLIEQHRDAESRALLEEAQTRFGDDARVLLLIAGASRNEGDLETARELYERVLSLHPDNTTATNNLAYLFLDQGKFDEAMELATKARELAPSSPDVADTLAWVYYRQGSYLAARSLLNEVVLKRADSAEVQYHMGMTLFRLDETDAARSYLERALALDPIAAFADEARRTLAALAPRPSER